jgi:hypothetical protein
MWGELALRKYAACQGPSRTVEPGLRATHSDRTIVIGVSPTFAMI